MKFPIAAALLFTAVNFPLQTARSENTPIKIGVLLCLTGDCAEWGTNGLKGIQLAAEELNNSGGITGRKIELVTEDSRDTSPNSAVAAYRRLTENKEIKFIIGPTWSVGGLPLVPLIKANSEIIVMSPSLGVREFNEGSDNIFNSWPHDEKATRELARYALKKGLKKAAIIGSQDPWVTTQSDVFAEEFTKGGGSIVSRVDPLPDTRELKGEAMKVRSANPDVVFMSNYQVDPFAKELRALKLEVPKLAILMEKERVKAAGGALEGTVFALYEEPLAGFKESFTKKFGSEPGISADTAYDALKLFAKAMTESGSDDTEKVKAQLLNTRNFRGASGTFSFDDKRAVDKKPVLWRVSGLEYVRVE